MFIIESTTMHLGDVRVLEKRKVMCEGTCMLRVINLVSVTNNSYYSMVDCVRQGLSCLICRWK